MANQIQEHMDVVGSDGQHVGRVDHVLGDGSLKLTKSDQAAGGVHHQIPKDWVDRVDGNTVRLRCSASEAQANWEGARQT